MTRNRARGDDGPDIAAAYDAEHLAGDLDTHETVLFPFAGLGRQIGLGNLAGEREHQCDRMFGGGDRIAKRRIHHDNAFPGGGGNIDINRTGARAADYFQPLRPLEKFGGDLRRRANGKAVETADDAGELVLVLAEARLKIGLDAALLEDRDGGSRRMMFELNKEGRGVNRKRVRRLMRVMGIEALVPRPGTSKAAPGHRIYPYLLRGLAITEPNHVWASDITYIPMAHGFLYLVAIIDWASRAVLAWRLSNTIDSGFCVEALEEALARHGKPRIFNTDQGAQFTSAAFTGKLEAAGVAISMDGRGRFMDNIFIERLWRSIKYEEVHLKAYADGREARAGIGSWMTFYNFRRRDLAC